MTKRQEMESVAERLNEALKPTGQKVIVSHRNNYTAIDYMPTETTSTSTNTIEAGLTDKTATMYMRAMLKAIDLISKPIKKIN